LSAREIDVARELTALLALAGEFLAEVDGAGLGEIPELAIVACHCVQRMVGRRCTRPQRRSVNTSSDPLRGRPPRSSASRTCAPVPLTAEEIHKDKETLKAQHRKGADDKEAAAA
jgi:hypothetical protein